MKRCSRCKETKDFEEFYRDRTSRDGYSYGCKICRKEQQRKLYYENKELFLVYQRKYYHENRSKELERSKKYRQEKGEKVLEYNRKYRQEKREKILEWRRKYVLKNKDKVRGWNRKYYHENKDKFVVIDASRRAKKLKATPSWLTEEHKKEITKLYRKARRLRERTGQDYHVDHMVPLKGDTVSGLHVPWNLQILKASENISKGNREWPDQWPS